MITYILNAALILAGCLIFYKVLLQKETFFPLNRFILLGCLALSFSLPLVPVPEKWSFRKTETPVVLLQKDQVAPVTTAQSLPVANTQKTVEKSNPAEVRSAFFDDISIVKFIVWLYWTGVIIFAINFLVQFITLLYRAYSRPVIIDGRFRIVELTGDKAPCSFGNNIFINPEKYEWDTYNQILLHEKIHIEQGHSFDILFAELALVFQWFNPFAWYYRKAVEDNLEFLTDNELLLHNNVERESYQLSLVKVSAPHFPVSLTTNYNQSILKKRLIMMNAKKSNIHTTWKYLFILPLMVAFVCFLNEPVAFGKPGNTSNTAQYYNADVKNSGVWFATIKGDKVNIQFKRDADDNNTNNTTFSLSEFKNLPKDKIETFSLTRDAGTINFTGKFDGDMGMGKYDFVDDKSFSEFLNKEGVANNPEKDAVVFFIIDLKKSYVTMLKNEGYKDIKSSDLIPLAALNVDQNFIKMLKSNGFSNVSLKQLIPLKAIGVDEKYIKEMKSAGYNLSYDQLLTYKAQDFSADFLKTSRDAAKADAVAKHVNTDKGDKGEKGVKGSKGDKDNNGDIDDDAFDNLIAMKALNITKEFVQGFADIGYKISNDDLIAFKALGVTPDYVKSIEAQGFNKPDAEDITGMKSLGVTPEDIKGYRALGFADLKISDIISAKATGTTPAYISAMKKKGYNLSSIDKYVSAKVLSFSSDIE